METDALDKFLDIKKEFDAIKQRYDTLKATYDKYSGTIIPDMLANEGLSEVVYEGVRLRVTPDHRGSINPAYQAEALARLAEIGMMDKVKAYLRIPLIPQSDPFDVDELLEAVKKCLAARATVRHVCDPESAELRFDTHWKTMGTILSVLDRLPSEVEGVGDGTLFQRKDQYKTTVKEVVDKNEAI